MKKNIQIFFALVIIATLSACKFDAKYIYIDNPTTKTIHVIIDDSLKYEVKPGEYKKVDMLPDGKHSMQTDGGVVKTFEMDKYHTHGLLNATGATYVNVTEQYRLDNAGKKVADMGYESMAKERVIDSATYYGIFTVLQDVYIEHDWQYDVVMPFPKTIDIYKESKTKFVTKLFRLEDFKKEYADSKVMDGETLQEDDTETLDRRDFYRATINKKTVTVWNNLNAKQQIATLNVGDTVDVEIIKGKYIRIKTLDNRTKGYIQREDVTNIKSLP